MSDRTTLGRSYEPSSIEARWYKEWEKKGYFRAGDDAANPNHFCILLPPPNVTGTLHMGHGFNQTLMDALARYHRMRGFNTLWQPGTDHAGIATQIVVERQLEAQGESRKALGREEFLKRVWKWKEISGDTILHQMRRLGASCDWSRNRFTMDEASSRVVTELFVRLHDEGLIYRGKRLVNWDPQLSTAVSDLEVETEVKVGRLWLIRYPGVDNPGVTIATTRPETLFGDVAVCVHPEDERYRNLIGQQVRLPLTDRTIPIIADEHVAREFGTGAVKVTPAHDFNDFEIGLRHNLPFITIFTLQAKMNDQAPEAYRGLDRFAARSKALEDLKTQNLLVESKPHSLALPICGRTGQIVEPMLTEQWFVAVNKPTRNGESLVKMARSATQTDLSFFPEGWANTYHHWLDNLEDWCISRQLWWGHRIPAWYDQQGRIVVARDETQALERWTKLYGHAEPDPVLRQDEDVLDTWFSSALWPLSTLDYQADAKQSPAMAMHYPTSVLVTGFDIIFFWVARMVMLCMHVTGKVPFNHVYVHGLIRDAEGQKMSKSRGNVLDPIDLIDGISLDDLLAKRTAGLMDPRQAEKIARHTRKEFPKGIAPFGADALRFTFASLASPGRDIKFDMSRCEGYRNFCNKLWNATWFVLMNCENQDCGIDETSAASGVPEGWIITRLQGVEAAVERHFADYRFDLVAQTLYAFVWDDFCDWYIECAKVNLTQAAISAQQIRETRRTLLRVLAAILKLLHPLLPFITEELWQAVCPLLGIKDATSLMVTAYPRANEGRHNPQAVEEFGKIQEWVKACRALRIQCGVPSGKKVDLWLCTQIADDKVRRREPYLMALARLGQIHRVQELPAKATAATTAATIAATEDAAMALDVEIAQDVGRTSMDKLKLEEEIARSQKKLANEDFIKRAPPQIVAQEKERLEKFQARLTKLEK